MYDVYSPESLYCRYLSYGRLDALLYGPSHFVQTMPDEEPNSGYEIRSDAAFRHSIRIHAQK